MARLLKAGVAAIGLLGVTTLGQTARRVSSRATELPPWERAERARDAFEAEPDVQRTKAEYTRVIDAFRSVYHEAPQQVHAAEAVNAVAELLAEQGRAEHDPKLLKAAVGQYEFLRTQYPGSSLRVAALLAEGQIEENDLHNPASARERYSLLLSSYPRSSLAEEARAGIASVDGGRSARSAVAGSASAGSASPAVIPQEEREHALLPGANPLSTNGAPAIASTHAEPAAPVARPPAPRKGPAAMVTGIRHWSTPSYTRVAIDLGGEVEYEAARVPNPDRIYFDLHGTRLAPDLAGKSFTVTDDGFLKKIRVAESSDGTARVVLDVNDVTEYSAFLLPNPYRLIIDIHGGVKAAGKPLPTMDAPVKPASTVPNTRAVNGGSGADVARLSDQPGKVEATSVPTSEPISAVVPDRTRVAATPGAGRTVQPSAVPSPEARPASSAASSTPSPAAPSDALPTRRKGRSRAKAADAKVVGDPATPARAAVPTADGETSLVRALGLKVGRIVIDAGHGGHDSGTIGVDGLEEKDVVLDVALRLGKLLRERLGADVIYTRSDDTFIPLETRTAIANKAQADLFLSIHANSSSEPSARGVETYYLNFTQQADALAVAARENAVSDQSIYQLSDLVKKIALKDKIAESREFAADVETSLYGGLAKGNEGLKNRGVKKAPFVVLIGANMPSILAEISFVTNPRDASELRQPDYRERVAESLYRGVARYAGGLSGTKPAVTVMARTGEQ